MSYVQATVIRLLSRRCPLGYSLIYKYFIELDVDFIDEVIPMQTAIKVRFMTI